MKPIEPIKVAMVRTFSRPIPLGLALAFCTFIPVMMAAVSVVQIPLGALPEDSLLLQVERIAAGLLDAARGVFGLALFAVLVRGVAAARARDMLRHRTWMIRAYAIGMGSGTVALVMFPIYLITGEPPRGLATDMVVVGMWLLNIALGEWVVGRGTR